MTPGKQIAVFEVKYKNCVHLKTVFDNVHQSSIKEQYEGSSHITLTQVYFRQHTPEFN